MALRRSGRIPEIQFIAILFGASGLDRGGISVDPVRWRWVDSICVLEILRPLHHRYRVMRHAHQQCAMILHPPVPVTANRQRCRARTLGQTLTPNPQEPIRLANILAQIDEQTLTIALGLSSLIAGGMFLTLRVFAKRIPGLTLWATGCLAVGFAMLIDGPRLISNWQLASMFFNVSFGSGQALLLAGTMQFCGVGRSWQTLGLLIAAGVALTMLFTFLVPDTILRIATLSIYQMAMNAGTALILWRRPDPMSRHVFKFASATAWIQAAAALAQGVIVVFSGQSVSYAAPQVPLANIISWGGAMINIQLGNWMLFLLVVLRLVAQIKESAGVDLLTGLPNRRGFRRHNDAGLARFGKQPGELGIMLLDIDHFKLVNDQYGHAMGDRALEIMGAVLAQYTSHNASPCRWGGEEFCIVMEDATPASLLAVASSIRSAFHSQTTSIVDGRAGMTVSVGIAYVAPRSAVEFSKVLAEADAQLYSAKNAGRDQIAIVEYVGSAADRATL